MMNNIPTAEDTLRSILSSCSIEYYELEESCPEIINECLEIIRKQNTLYVEAALKAAAENAKITTEYYHEEDVGITKVREILDSADIVSERTDGDGVLYAVDTYHINKESILNAYPKENIK